MAKRGRKKKREKIGMWWGLSGEQKERIIGAGKDGSSHFILIISLNLIKLGRSSPISLRGN